MKYFKRLEEDGIYIASVRTGEAVLDETDIEITESDYNVILAMIPNKPADTEEVLYKLRDSDMEWIAVEREPYIPEPTAEEILDILLGGDTE